jgi:hypothetical protein
MNKFYKATIRLKNDDRIEVCLQYDNILNIIEDFSGNKLSFISKDQPDRKSFTLYAHDIKRIDYEVVNLIMPYDRQMIYVLHSKF